MMAFSSAITPHCPQSKLDIHLAARMPGSLLLQNLKLGCCHQPPCRGIGLGILKAPCGTAEAGLCKNEASQLGCYTFARTSSTLNAALTRGRKRMSTSTMGVYDLLCGNAKRSSRTEGPQSPLYRSLMLPGLID